MNKPTRYKLCASKFISGFTPIKDVQSRQNGRRKNDKSRNSFNVQKCTYGEPY